jgi:hypothetical protein
MKNQKLYEATTVTNSWISDRLLPPHLDGVTEWRGEGVADGRRVDIVWQFATAEIEQIDAETGGDAGSYPWDAALVSCEYVGEPCN